MQDQIITSVDEKIKDFISRKADVSIHRNDELGELKFSVEVNEQPGFWLDSFDTESEARCFVTVNGLRITKFYNSVSSERECLYK